MDLKQAEKQLDVLIDAGNETGWARVAQVLEQVETGELWKPGHHSFSAWVKSYSLHKGCSESLLWKYCKAGRAYRAARAVAPELPPMEQAQVSAEVVVTCEKIHGEDRQAAAKLLGKVEQGELSAKDVREIWKAQRKVAGVRKSRHEAKPQARPAEGDGEMTRRLTAALAAQAGSWIWGAETKKEAEARKKAHAARDFFARDAVCVRTLTEFPVRVETAERARQIDLAAVTVENQTTADWMEVTLWGVEVKVSEHDFERDQKMGDYALFMDYMSIGVPFDLVERVQDAVPAEWGVLGYDPEEDTISVVREPERLDAPRREQALMTACVKLARRDVK